MIKKYLILIIILLALSCKAQIVAVEHVLDDFSNVEEGVTTYIKDVNNVLDDYVGTWTGIQNGKKYTFVITEKTIVFDEDYNIDADILIMKHLIVDTQNQEVIENTLSYPDDDAPSTGMLFINNTSGGLTYLFSYGGEEYFCGQNGDVYITLKNNNTQLYIILGSDHEMFAECLTGYAGQVLPTEGLLLDRE